MADHLPRSILLLKESLSQAGDIMTSIKAFIKGPPVAAYFVLAFAICWGGILLVVGPGGFPGTPEQFETLLPLVGLAMLIGPPVAGILLTGLVNGRAGLREFLSRLLRWRVGVRWYAVALVTGGSSTCSSSPAGRRASPWAQGARCTILTLPPPR
jgi:uncharacterized protein